MFIVYDVLEKLIISILIFHYLNKLVNKLLSNLINLQKDSLTMFKRKIK